MNLTDTRRDDLRRAEALRRSPSRLSTLAPSAPAGWEQAFMEDAVAILAQHRGVPFSAMFVAATSSYPWDAPEATEPDDDVEMGLCPCGAWVNVLDDDAVDDHSRCHLNAGNY